ncbi:Repressor CsoR of the copZA operon [hydrothermal vent metagenome]|uniref:Copper-sensing transcriptional repressor CsoR n=1 Tax=hydrothermal vent metagenome TaxID=652676 RepID=A0A3B1CGS3_9ZZZZ
MLEEVKKSALLNLKTARGQIEGIMKMIDDGRYCIDVSKQILSAQSLLKKANLEILRGHVKTCVRDAIEKGEGDEKIEEIFNIIEKYAKPNG